MKKKSRTILFIICIFLFVLVAPVAILYSQGYRIDFEENKISQTGGLYFKILPKQAEVYLGCELEKKTDFFFGSALIENLLPGEYQIEVKKEGYHSWQKTLEIKEKQVAEAKNIVLFPEDPGIKVLIREVEDFWFSPDQKKIILLEEDKPSSPTSLSPEESSVKEKSQYGWALKLYETEKNIKSHLIDKTIISLGIVELLDVEFSEDSKEITLKVGVDETIKHYNLNLEQFPIRLIAASPPPPFPLKGVIASKEINNDIYYLKNTGHLFKNEEKLTQEPFPAKAETRYTLDISQDFIFLRENLDLYQLKTDTNTFEKLSEEIKDLKISPDNKKLAYVSDYEIWIFFLKEINGATQKKPGDTIFLMRLSEKIDSIFWLESNYLVFNSGDIIKITEVDERDRINIIELAQIKNPDIFWNKTDNKLYILSEGNLHSSESLLP